MSAIIISFNPYYGSQIDAMASVDKLANAAWQFAYSALWPEENLSRTEVEATKDYIREYFLAAKSNHRAFIAMIQRIVLTRNYLNHSEDRSLPDPSIWFNRRYPFGFAGTLPWLRGVEDQRAQIPGYLGHVLALAENYYRYARKPSPKNFERCRQALLNRQAHHLLEILYSTVAHTIHNRA
jgi:hypothetical protein